MTAQAVEWAHVATSDRDNLRIHMDRDVYRAHGKAGALAQRETTDGRVLRFFVTVTLQECKQGFGVLVISDVDGRNQFRGGEFVLDGTDSVGDAMGTYLCRTDPVKLAKGGGKQ